MTACNHRLVLLGWFEILGSLILNNLNGLHRKHSSILASPEPQFLRAQNAGMLVTQAINGLIMMSS